MSFDVICYNDKKKDFYFLELFNLTMVSISIRVFLTFNNHVYNKVITIGKF